MPYGQLDTQTNAEYITPRPMQHRVGGRSKQGGYTVAAMGADHDQVATASLGETQDFMFHGPDFDDPLNIGDIHFFGE